MTKAEYEAKNQELRDKYVCDSDCFGRLVDVDSDYIESLESENARLEKLFAKACEIITELNGVACADWKAWIEKTVAKESK